MYERKRGSDTKIITYRHELQYRVASKIDSTPVSRSSQSCTRDCFYVPQVRTPCHQEETRSDQVALITIESLFVGTTAKIKSADILESRSKWVKTSGGSQPRPG